MIRCAALAAAALVLLSPADAAQQGPAPAAQPSLEQTSKEARATVDALVATPRFAQARARLDADYDRTIAELIRITETPAPPFQEAARAKLMADLFRQHGLRDVTIDAAGNVLGLRPGTGGGRLLVISAHLDTVFPADTPIKVRREGNRLLAPGIGDDSLGLAAMLAWMRALDAASVRTRDDILFVGTVGEEGRGDLRGVRYLFGDSPLRDRIAAFVSVDGSQVARVVHGAVGSRRYRVTFSGPGGHSYGAFGSVNPLAALSDAVHRLYLINPPTDPKTTYSASVAGGGTSINSIPESVFVDIDMRSPDRDALKRLDERFLAIVAEAVAAENGARSTANGAVSAKSELVGDRPAGATPAEHPLVQLMLAANRAHGVEPRLDHSSTDSNIPMSLGVPALTIGTGAGGGRSHSLEEYLEVERTPFLRGLSIGLAFALAAAGPQ